MTDRKVRIAVSRDSGHNYGDWREQPLGEVGEYRKRVRFNRFGQAENWAVKVRITSPIRADLMQLAAEIEPGE